MNMGIQDAVALADVLHQRVFAPAVRTPALDTYSASRRPIARPVLATGQLTRLATLPAGPESGPPNGLMRLAAQTPQ